MSEWIVDSLNRLVVFQKGRKVQTSDFELPGYAPYLGAGALSGNDDRYASTILAIMANEQDVLMLWDGERSGLVGHGLSGVVSSTVSKLTPTGKINSRLLYYLLLFNFEWIQNRRTGTGVPHVPKDLGRILKLSYPVDLGLQGKIAYILSSIDQAIKKTETLIEKYQQIKAGLMHDLFTRGIGADGKLRPPRDQAPELYQETLIGWIPKEWGVCGIMDICAEVFLGLTTKVDYVDDGGIPLVRATNINDGKLSFENALYISEKQHRELTRYRKPKFGDVLISKSGSLGVCAIVDQQREFSIYESIIVLQPRSERLNSEFLLWMMRSASVQRRLLGETVGSTVGHLNLLDFRRLLLPLVPQSEQVQIGKLLCSHQTNIENILAQVRKLLAIKSGLMHDLLTGKVLVKVDESEQEPA